MKPFKRINRKLKRKAFISDALVDIWAIIIFVIVIIIFAVLYKWSAEAKMQQLQDKRDIIYGNYLAQVYLRTPLTVAGEEMTVAELISLYDYNQTLEKEIDESYAEVVESAFLFILGKRNPMRKALINITDKFVKDNFDRSKCFMFSIHSDAFDYNLMSSACPSTQGFSIHYLLSRMDWVPSATFATYMAPIDPRGEPIILYSIYDFDRLLSLYSPDPYFGVNDARRWSVGMMCDDPAVAFTHPACGGVPPGIR